MTSMLSNMTSWFAGVPPDDGPSEVQPNEDGNSDSSPKSAGQETSPADVGESTKTTKPAESEDATPQAANQGSDTTPNPDNPQIDLDEMAEKTLTAAKEWGSEYLTVLRVKEGWYDWNAFSEVILNNAFTSDVHPTPPTPYLHCLKYPVSISLQCLQAGDLLSNILSPKLL